MNIIGHKFNYSSVFTRSEKRGKFIKATFNDPVIDGYMLWVPDNYEKDRNYPIILSLHSYHEMGGKVENAISMGPTEAILSGNPALKFVRENFFVLSPGVLSDQNFKFSRFNNPFFKFRMPE